MSRPARPRHRRGARGAARFARGRRARVLPVTLPLLAIVLTGCCCYTRGYHIDLEVYRLGVATWLAGGDMYGPLPPTVSGLALPFIYPPFAAMVLLPLEMLPWTAAWIALYVASLVSVAVTLYVVARRASGPPVGPAAPLSVASARAAGGAAAGAGARDLRVRPGQPRADGARGRRLPGARAPAGRAACSSASPRRSS